jgi:hypothetical protein
VNASLCTICPFHLSDDTPDCPDRTTVAGPLTFSLCCNSIIVTRRVIEARFQGFSSLTLRVSMPLQIAKAQQIKTPDSGSLLIDNRHTASVFIYEINFNNKR